MAASYHRHDISDAAWALIEPHTIGNKGTWGGNAKDTRLFIDAVFWILHTGAPWRDLPPVTPTSVSGHEITLVGVTNIIVNFSIQQDMSVVIPTLGRKCLFET